MPESGELFQRADNGHDEIHEFYNVSRSSYWTRAWIAQEIALARNIRLLSQDIEVDGFMLSTSSRPSIWRLDELREIAPDAPHAGLFELVHVFRGKQCVIRRDSISSLLALCKAGPDIIVDYNKPDKEVMLQVL
jgi:hypothetical protein